MKYVYLKREKFRQNYSWFDDEHIELVVLFLYRCVQFLLYWLYGKCFRNSKLLKHITIGRTTIDIKATLSLFCFLVVTQYLYMDLKSWGMTLKTLTNYISRFVKSSLVFVLRLPMLMFLKILFACLYLLFAKSVL
jgi:hypothetical protein